MKLYAIRDTDLIEVPYEDSGVIFKVKPLPFKVKRDLIHRATVSQKSEDVVDTSEVAIMAVKYGCCGWSGFKARDGVEVIAKLEQCPDYEVECLAEESLNMLYRSSAFGTIVEAITNPSDIDEFIEKGKKKKASKKG